MPWRGVLTRSTQLRSSLVQVGLLLAAALTYLWFPDDAVWSAIKTRPNRRLLEHLCFGMAALLIGLSLAIPQLRSLRSGARGTSPTLADVRTSRLLNALGIATLFPLPGSLLLLAGEIMLAFHTHPGSIAVGVPPRTALPPRLLNRETGRLCGFVSMIAFAVTLNDRTAEILFGLTALLSLLHTLGLAAELSAS